MKVLLIYPNVLDLARFKEKRKEFPPFGVLYLAAVAEREGYEVEIRDVTLGESLDLKKYDVIGFSIPSSATYGIIREVRFRSQYKEGAKILVGGVHPTLYPIETLKDLRPDILVAGEGEDVFIEILDSIKKNGSIYRIKGVYFLENEHVSFSGKRQVSRDIDWLPALPARHLLPEESFIMDDRLSDTDIRMAHVMFSRGCPFPCAFCAAAGTKIQYRSGWHAQQELTALKDRYDIWWICSHG